MKMNLKMKLKIMKIKINMKMKMKLMKIKMNMNMKVKMNMNMKMKMKMIMMKQWVKTKKTKIIKEKNDYLDKIIDESKSSEQQIKSLEKRKDLKKYYTHKDFGDKELKSKYFKIKLADMSNNIEEKLFKPIFGHILIKLANKLMNATDQKENQIIVKNINASKKKVIEQEKTMPYDWVIQPSYQRINLKKAIKLVLGFNESKLKDLVWMQFHWKDKN